MKKSIALFFIAATVTSAHATEQSYSIEIITTAKRLLKLQTELAERSHLFNISYVASLISMNKENLALVKDDVIKPSLMLLDEYLEEALSALKELLKIPTANNNHIEIAPEKTKFLDAMHHANNELKIIDDTLRIPDITYT